MAESRGGRRLVINTALITPKSKRDTQGMQVYLSKRDKFLRIIYLADQEQLESLKPYYSERIPSSGRALKEEDKPYVQMDLF